MLKADSKNKGASADTSLLIEWPTLLVAIICYAGIATATLFADALTLWLAWPLLVLCLTLHSSIQHEVLHGHPFSTRWLSEALVFPAVGMFIPFDRFRDLHLAHHRDPSLTDPYDDPESNYLDPVHWSRLSAFAKTTYRFNNTLFGRMIIGPAISLSAMLRNDLKTFFDGNHGIAIAYIKHLIGLALVAIWLTSVGTIAAAAYLTAAYAAMSVLKIRTFLEHRAHESVPGRTVVIEDRGLLAFLFLNNNFHSVHHAYPKLHWYRLPALYSAKRDEFVKRNRDYVYRSYFEIIGLFLFKAKDPVPHPLMENVTSDIEQQISASVATELEPEFATVKETV